MPTERDKTCILWHCKEKVSILAWRNDTKRTVFCTCLNRKREENKEEGETDRKSWRSNPDQLFSVSESLSLSPRVSLVSGLGRGTFRDPNSGTWCRSLFSLVSYLQEIYFFDAILPSFGIHQVEYLSKDQTGERKRKEKECYGIKMEKEKNK